ncbi:MAG TPA: hypothetical protein VNC41_06400, partial [Acidimicrobiia bacterium]|nr:hypothetical protein [Acidimicrobiia bacterium]
RNRGRATRVTARRQPGRRPGNPGGCLAATTAAAAEPGLRPPSGIARTQAPDPLLTHVHS